MVLSRILSDGYPLPSVDRATGCQSFQRHAATPSRQELIFQDLAPASGLHVAHAGPAFPPVKKGIHFWKYMLKITSGDERAALARLCEQHAVSITIDPEQP